MPSIPIARGSPRTSMENFNTFMLRLNRLLSTQTGMDKVLMTVSYSLQLLPSKPRSNLQTLSSLVSDVRVFMRLFGLVGIYAWLQETLRSRHPDPVVLAQVASSAAFQLLENAAYLAQHGVLAISRRTQAKLWTWSARFWMCHVVLEFLRLGRGKRGLGWDRELVSNCAYAPLTLHWSIEGGAVPQEALATCGGVAAVIGLQNEWRKTA